MFVDFNILNQLGSPSINSNTFANRPAAGQTGRLFVSTDTFEIYRDNGTTWDLIGGPGSSTITGTGTATQVAYFTSSQAIGSSANLFWDNTNTRLGVGTASPAYTIEANGDILAEAIYLDGATAGNGALYWTSDRVTVANYNVGGIVHIETNGGVAAAIFAANYTATFTSGIGTNGYTGSTSYAALFNGSIGVGIATPSGLIHADGGASAARIILDADTGVARIFSFRTDNLPRWALRVDGTETGSNAGADFALRAYDDTGTFTFAPMSVTRATGKTSFQATQTYTTGLARGNYFDYNLSVSAGGSFSSPNAITALGASLDLTLAGSATIPSGARSGLDAYNSIGFTGTGTLTHTQGTQIRAYSNVTAGWAFNGSATGTITHLAGLRVLFPDNTGSAVTITNNYALLLNDQTANTGTVTYTNRWGVYQEGASDLNYMAANLLLGSTTNSGEKLQVTGSSIFTASGNSIKLVGNDIQYTRAGINYISCTDSIGSLQIYTGTTNLGIAQNLSGNVGIGTITANYKLTVNSSTSGFTSIAAIGNSDTGNSTTALLLQNTSGTESAGTGVNLNFAGASNWLGRINPVFTGGTGSGNADMTFWTPLNGTIAERMRITSGGILQIAGGGNDNVGEINMGNLAQNNYRFQIRHESSAWILKTVDSEPLTFSTSNSERMRITSGGNVLIGTTTDSGNRLQVTGGTLRVDEGTNGNVSAIFASGNVSGLIQISSSSSNYISAGSWYGYMQYNSATYHFFSQRIEISGSVKTSNPTTGTAAEWKLGSRVAAAVALDATQYIEVEVGGTFYKLAIVT